MLAFELSHNVGVVEHVVRDPAARAVPPLDEVVERVVASLVDCVADEPSL